MTHDYKRNGTTTLFTALSMLDGRVTRRFLSACLQQCLGPSLAPILSLGGGVGASGACRRSCASELLGGRKI
jgi:hypothetical protein